MNVLIVGKHSGSWAMRGLQLGGAIGARVTSSPVEADWRWAQCVVLVKRAARTYAPIAQAHGIPIVWDALDFWQQPADNRLDEQAALTIATLHVEAIKPAIVIGATEAMAEAVDGVCLPHHGWEGLSPAPVRETCQVVAYDGNPSYLDRWASVLARTCERRGWRFVSALSDLRDADILVALRGGGWDGWMCRQWKSGVKIANAVLAGRPIITQDTAAWREIKPTGSAIATVDDLETALDHWSTLPARTQAWRDAMVRWQEFSLPVVAARYRGILEKVAPC